MANIVVPSSTFDKYFNYNTDENALIYVGWGTCPRFPYEGTSAEQAAWLSKYMTKNSSGKYTGYAKDSSGNPYFQFVPMYCPSEMDATIEDLSESDAGRDEYGVMHKKMTAQNIRSIKLTWNNITIEEARYILNVFSESEYFYPTVFDMFNGYHLNDSKAYTYGDYSHICFPYTKFYLGNRSVNMYNRTLGIVGSVSFSIIQVGSRWDTYNSEDI